MVEIFFYHTIEYFIEYCSHRILLILVRLFHQNWNPFRFFLLFNQSLIRTQKSSLSQINHFDLRFLRIL